MTQFESKLRNMITDFDAQKQTFEQEEWAKFQIHNLPITVKNRKLFAMTASPHCKNSVTLLSQQREISSTTI